MSDSIFIQRACFPCHIGVTKEERASVQDILIDVDLKIDLAPAGRSDSIHDTVNYSEVWAAMNECAAAEEFRLVEALAARVGRAILERFPLVEAVDVRVTKPRALATKGVSNTGVHVSVSREDTG